MKKSLFALAALGAFASAAQAQSSVTLYGTLDTSVAYLTGVSNTATTTATSVSATQTTGSGMFFIDGAWITSQWGMRGAEDLGGGKKAIFDLQSDALMNNGNIHNGGLFRRAAYVGLEDANLGGIHLGRRGNAYILATGTMLPVSGNTAHQWRTAIGSSVGDQVANSVNYISPTIMGTQSTIQYGLNNTIDGGDDGTIFAANLFNRSIPNLTISAGYNNMKGSRTVGQATATSATSVAQTPGVFVGAANQTVSNREGYAVGLKYKVTPAIEVGTFYAHGRLNNGGQTGGANTGFSAGATGAGVGYQLTPETLLGANYVKSTFQSSMVNLQAHYSMSKRTRIYSMMTFTQAAKVNFQNGSSAGLSFSPIQCNSAQNTSISASAPGQCAMGLATNAGSGVIPASSNAYSVGVIHSF